jgi:hypothetical protein
MGLCEADSPEKLRENSTALLVSSCGIDALCAAAFFESVIPNYSSYYPSTFFGKGHWYGWRASDSVSGNTTRQAQI